MAIQNKKIIILGSTGKIGKELANKLKKNELYLSFKKKRLTSFNSLENVKFFSLNFKKPESFLMKLKKYKKIFKSADLIVNTIGTQGQIDNFYRQKLDNFEDTFNINFILNFILIKFIYSIVKKDKRILILLLSGGGSLSYRKNFFSYSIAKICLVKLTEIAAKEVSKKFFRINIISPGVFLSNMTKQVLKNYKKTTKSEIMKINSSQKKTNNNIEKLVSLIEFLLLGNGKILTGKVISSSWDRITAFSLSQIKKIQKSEKFLLRRVG